MIFLHLLPRLLGKLHSMVIEVPEIKYVFLITYFFIYYIMLYYIYKIININEKTKYIVQEVKQATGEPALQKRIKNNESNETKSSMRENVETVNKTPLGVCHW